MLALQRYQARSSSLSYPFPVLAINHLMEWPRIARDSDYLSRYISRSA